MIYLSPALDLNRVASANGYVPVWVVGEAIGILLVLVPSMLLFRWTEDNTHLGFRALGQVILSALIFLYLIPELVFALRPDTAGWSPLLTTSHFLQQLWLQILLVLAVVGISGVQEFVVRGDGTPLPYDPPHQLVTSGVYRYCANPMQLSCIVVMLAEAIMLRSLWLVAAAVMSAVYSAGLAHWHEEAELAQRFSPSANGDAGEESSATAQSQVNWTTYRAAVPIWKVRWRPFTAGPPAVLYVAATCQTCRGVRAFLEQRDPVGLLLADAETLPSGAIRRLRYLPTGAPTESGVLAFARALEHLNFGWAFLGFLLRLPVIHHAAQLFTDVAGFGPRTLDPSCYAEQRSTRAEDIDTG